MTITADDVLDRADYLLKQAGVAEGVRRWQQAEMFLHVRDAQNAIITARPEASAAVVTLTFASGARQTLDAAHYALLRLHGMRMFDRDTLDAYDPDWESATAATPEEYYYDPKIDRTAFYVNPPAPATSPTNVATVSKAAIAVTATSDVLVVNDEWLEAAALYCAHKAMSKQADYAMSGVDASFYTQFKGLIE